MYDPPHPGLIVRQECIKPLHLTITDVARGLGVMRKALSELVNGHAGVSPEMAIRLAKAFSGSPESWLRLQMQHDLWQAQQRADRGEEVRDASAGGVTPRIDDGQRSAPDP